jgi:uncharacterized membrane protein YeaQ/YmgE (transglycosylase-associated protein family)
MMVAFVHCMSARDVCSCTQAFNRLALVGDVILGIVQSKVGDAICWRLPVQLGLWEPGMALLPKTAFIDRGTEFAIDDGGQLTVFASNLPAPIVGPWFGAIPKGSIAELWNIRYAGGKITVFVMAHFLGADRRQTGNQYQFIRWRQLHDLAGRK